MDQDFELDLPNFISNDHLSLSNDPEFFIPNLDHDLEYEFSFIPQSEHSVSSNLSDKNMFHSSFRNDHLSLALGSDLLHFGKEGSSIYLLD